MVTQSDLPATLAPPEQPKRRPNVETQPIRSDVLAVLE
jgi:hypothetical protein